MVNPLESFSASANVMGAEIDLIWALPEVLPANYKVYIFQRSRQDVDQVTDINRFFQSIEDLSNYNYNGLYVSDQLSPNETELQILAVKNGLIYYYKAVVRDEDTGDYSTALSTNAIPDCSIEIETQDGKELVKQALDSMLDSVKDKNGNKVKLGKDIEVVKGYQLGEIDNKFLIERVNGNTQYQYAGGLYATYNYQLIHGEVDVDVIRATYMTLAGNDRRDLMSNILRGRKLWLKKRLKELKVKDVTITIEGDYYNPQLHGVNTLGVTVIFSLLVENFTKENKTILNQHNIEKMEVV